MSRDSTTSDKTYGSEREPSHIMEGDYVALMETNDHECESWYFFIRREGNEEYLRHLQNQLEQVRWTLEEDVSTFDLDLDHNVSAKTAKEMTKLELNSYMFHRKFDGKLKKIDLDFNKKDSHMEKMVKAFEILGYGQIEDYISDEDLDPEDLESNSAYSSTEEESDSEGDDKTEYSHGRIPASIRSSITNRKTHERS